ADAFQDDPVWLWIAPDEARRQKHLESMFAQVVRSRVVSGLSYTTDSFEGAAVWAEPGSWRMNLKENLRVITPSIRTIGPRPLRRAAKALATIEKLHPSEPHWYLEFLASRVDLRGRGFGSAVLQPMLDRCDFEAMPAYLESSKSENIPFYERFGFKVVEEFSIGKDGPLMWTMWRDPLEPR
ncbi:MAG TPA: GNAT family N-acetyltransferase, partial [Microthrixaceae bacterium]|nr:GNAT family N-acetyltransferase [Microthrixaceae bacterium]